MALKKLSPRQQPARGAKSVSPRRDITRTHVQRSLGSSRTLGRHTKVPRDFMKPQWALNVVTALNRRLVPYRASSTSRRKGHDGDHGDSRNDDICAICRMGGILLCCDACSSAFHLGCLGLKQTPTDDEWLCIPCRQSKLLQTIFKRH